MSLYLNKIGFDCCQAKASEQNYYTQYTVKGELRKILSKRYQEKWKKKKEKRYPNVKFENHVSIHTFSLKQEAILLFKMFNALPSMSA